MAEGWRQIIRDDWHKAARAWSTWVAAAGAVLFTLLQEAPHAALAAWDMLPAELRSLLPHSDRLAMLLFGLIFVLRFLRQEQGRKENEP
jgi:ABC-type branched-subunit amino acid transport system permease subunit